MIEMNPTPAMTDAELAAWFGAAGLAVTVVDRCPVAACPSCTASHTGPAAKAA